MCAANLSSVTVTDFADLNHFDVPKPPNTDLYGFRCFSSRISRQYSGRRLPL